MVHVFEHSLGHVFREDFFRESELCICKGGGEEEGGLVNLFPHFLLFGQLISSLLKGKEEEEEEEEDGPSQKEEEEEEEEAGLDKYHISRTNVSRI